MAIRPHRSSHRLTAEELQAEAEQEPDDDKRAVLKQGIRFARIAQRYREAMLANGDEAALALLERICLFRLGASVETLASVFVRTAMDRYFERQRARMIDAGQDESLVDAFVPAREVGQLSGKYLARLTEEEVSDTVSFLASLGLVQIRDEGSVRARDSRFVTAHAVIRSAFDADLPPETLACIHEAVSKQLESQLSVTLWKSGRRQIIFKSPGDPPDTSPSSPSSPVHVFLACTTQFAIRQSGNARIGAQPVLPLLFRL